MTAKSKPVCPGCGVRQRDSLLCDGCMAKLVGALELIPPAPARPGEFVAGPSGTVRVGRRQSLPWERDGWPGLLAELELSRLRQSRRAAHVAGGHSDGSSLPFDDRADAGADLAAALARWCLVLSPSDPPADPAVWLLANRARVRRHPQAAELAAEVTRLVDRCLAVVGSPPQRQHLGQCEVCGADLFADRRRDDDAATCRKCKRVVTGIKERRESRLSQALDGLATRSEILSVLPDSFGLKVSQSRFSNWLSSGRLQSRGRSLEPNAAGEEQGVPTYRLGDVVDLARRRPNTPRRHTVR